MEGAEDLFAGVGLEPLVLNVGDDQAGPAVVQGQGGQRGRGNVDVSDPDSALWNIFFLNVHRLVLVLHCHICQGSLSDYMIF